MPENSRNSFVDLQSKKQWKRRTKNAAFFIEGWDVISIKNLYKLLPPLSAALK